MLEISQQINFRSYFFRSLVTNCRTRHCRFYILRSSDVDLCISMYTRLALPIANGKGADETELSAF